MLRCPRTTYGNTFDRNGLEVLLVHCFSVSVAFGKRESNTWKPNFWFHFVTFSSFRFQLEPIQTKPKSGAPSNA